MIKTKWLILSLSQRSSELKYIELFYVFYVRTGPLHFTNSISDTKRCYDKVFEKNPGIRLNCNLKGNSSCFSLCFFILNF